MSQITRYRGDTWPIKMTILRDDEPMDITDCSFILTVDSKKQPTDELTNLFQLTGVIEGDPTDGIVLFEPSEVDVDRIGKFYYDVQVEDTSGKKRTIAKDRFVLTQDITKD
jgi:hypothetical protein